MVVDMHGAGEDVDVETGSVGSTFGSKLDARGRLSSAFTRATSSRGGPKGLTT